MLSVCSIVVLTWSACPTVDHLFKLRRFCCTWLNSAARCCPFRNSFACVKTTILTKLFCDGGSEAAALGKPECCDRKVAVGQAVQDQATKSTLNRKSCTGSRNDCQHRGNCAQLNSCTYWQQSAHWFYPSLCLITRLG